MSEKIVCVVRPCVYPTGRDLTKGLVLQSMEKSNATILKNHVVENFKRSEQMRSAGGVSTTIDESH